MKPKDIIIAAILIIILSSVLSGCGLVEKTAPSEAKVTQENTSIIDLVNKAESVKKDVKYAFETEKSDKQVKVKIYLDNPSSKPVTSVQSWLSFDPSVVKGAAVNTKDSALALNAPYDNNFDNTNGLVMLGRSNPEPITSSKIYVAEIVFDILKNDSVFLNAYDYREDLSGHSSVNMMLDGSPFNVLQRPESPAFVIQK